jgi:serine protease AprX
MTSDPAMSPCATCGRFVPLEVLAESAWLPAEVAERLAPESCPGCWQAELAKWFMERADDAGPVGLLPFRRDGRLIPFGVLPSGLLLGADPRATGRGVTLAMIDSGFFPHPDVTGDDRNRIRAWADTSTPQIHHRFFNPAEPPRWPGWDEQTPAQWHGLMTAAAAAGSGAASHGWYRGFAPEADLVFVQTWDANGRITNDGIARALRWLLEHRECLNLRIVNLSVGGDPVRRLAGNFVDAAVDDLVSAGITVVTAAGNKGVRRLLPPASAASAITVGGLDTRNSPDPAAWTLWHGNWGRASDGSPKPDLIAPAIWVAAPMLPGTKTASEAEELFRQRDADDPEIEQRIAEQKLLTPRYQHVDGTSFAAALLAGVVAGMIQVNPSLSPRQVKQILMETAMPLPGTPQARQGAGMLRPALAVEWASQKSNKHPIE